MARKRGSLVVVGTGIESFGQMTTSARAHLRAADKVLHIVADPLTERELRKLNPKSESLRGLYGTGKHRLATYAGMARRMIDEVHKGHRVCAALYGHPGVFAMPAHAAIRVLRDEGYPARMLPAVSADACLIADLGIDPATDGWQSYEATDYLLRDRKVDPSSGLVLWQAGVVGCVDYPGSAVNRKNVKVLTDVLLKTYPGRHEVTLYEAATLPGYLPVIEKFPLRTLPDSPLTSISTLYIPPARRAPVNRGLAKKLGLDKRTLASCLR